jgi:hypothetical protein
MGKRHCFYKDAFQYYSSPLSVLTEEVPLTEAQIPEKKNQDTCALCGQKVCSEVYKANWQTRAFIFERQDCLVLFDKLASIYGESFVSVLPNQ